MSNEYLMEDTDQIRGVQRAFSFQTQLYWLRAEMVDWWSARAAFSHFICLTEDRVCGASPISELCKLVA